jgi:hypothetical protein
MTFQETEYNSNDTRSHTGSVIVTGNQLTDTFKFYYVDQKRKGYC